MNNSLCDWKNIFLELVLKYLYTLVDGPSFSFWKAFQLPWYLSYLRSDLYIWLLINDSVLIASIKKLELLLIS